MTYVTGGRFSCHTIRMGRVAFFVQPQQTRVSASAQNKTGCITSSSVIQPAFSLFLYYDMTLRAGLTRRNRIAISGVVSGQSSS